MSVTMFTRPDDDPELVPDNDLDLEHGPGEERLRPNSKKHLFCLPGATFGAVKKKKRARVRARRRPKGRV